MTVTANLEGETWDLLLSLDVLPGWAAGGAVVCALCEGANRRVFPTVEALWGDHLFEPLAAWIKDKVARAEVLAFYQSEGKGATWAELREGMASVRNAVHVITL